MLSEKSLLGVSQHRGCGTEAKPATSPTPPDSAPAGCVTWCTFLSLSEPPCVHL